ncbi:hypothetical protein BJV82DRAFT_286006 [Fennellomyces sp. T-0311]|nr:hypothetical protein BJV82DRAFT_286006 [Fennellomyces sp. T-0311]
MSHFPFFLPADIVCEIFSHLEQEDCIQCMRVCHRWHSEIPHYTTQHWERIVIAPFGLNKTNECMLRCLAQASELCNPST